MLTRIQYQLKVINKEEEKQRSRSMQRGLVQRGLSLMPRLTQMDRMEGGLTAPHLKDHQFEEKNADQMRSLLTREKRTGTQWDRTMMVELRRLRIRATIRDRTNGIIRRPGSPEMRLGLRQPGSTEMQLGVLRIWPG